MARCAAAFRKASLSERAACKDSMFMTWEMIKVSIGAALAAGVRRFVAMAALSWYAYAHGEKCL